MGPGHGRALLGVVAALFATAPAASASHTKTLASSNYVPVDDVGSNAHTDGCGDRAALSGGFANRFDRRRSKLFIFGFNPIGRTSDFPVKGSPLPFGPSWRVTVANRGEGSGGGGKQITFAYCVKRPPRLHLEEADARIGPSAKATATAWCPRGMEAVSGGFSDLYAGTNGSLVFGFRSMRIGSRGWRASAVNISDSVASRLVVSATCSRGRPGLSELSRTIKVAGGASRSTTIRCAPGREPWSAGFESRVDATTGAGAYPHVFRRVGDRSWRAAAFAEGPAARFTVHVLCGDSEPPHDPPQTGHEVP